ncbi:MAG TPA: SpoIIE family protein phosphatase, partial [Bacteroidia bacterium]|nr:SpoIIE family protein phosphatase [Bacteroidia bacterium]
ISLTTLERVYVSVNKKFLEIFGYSEEEIIGRTSIEIGILDLKESKKVGDLFRENNKLQNDIVMCIAKSGKEIYTVSSIEKIEINGCEYMMSSFLNISKIIEQQHIIEKQHKELVESINYASFIQNTIFPTPDQIKNILPESFVLVKPKNIVSGDFYWVKEREDKIFIAACDCTGHGVPGALISILGFKLLNKFIVEYHLSNPAEILNSICNEFASSENQLDLGNKINDGMDIALCNINKTTMTMEYAGAYNPIYLIRNGELTKLVVDKIPLRLFSNNTDEKFGNYQIKLKKGDLISLFSDGYADQFGGPKGKKFMYKPFQDLLLSIHNLPMDEQNEILDKKIEEWKNTTGDEQTDDILIFGFKI